MFGVGVLEDVAEAHAVDEIHDYKGAQPKRVAGSGTPGVDFRDRNTGPLTDETQDPHLHGNFLVGIAIVDIPHTPWKTDHPGSAVAETHFNTSAECIIVEGTLELAGKPTRMEGGHLLAEMARSVSLVHFVDPELALYLVGKINERAIVHYDISLQY